MISELALRVVRLPGVAVRRLCGSPTRTISAVTTRGLSSVPAVTAMVQALQCASAELHPVGELVESAMMA